MKRLQESHYKWSMVNHCTARKTSRNVFGHTKRTSNLSVGLKKERCRSYGQILAKREESEIIVDVRNRSRRTALTEQLAGIACLHLAPLRGAAAQQIVHNLPIEDLRRTIAHDFQHNQYYITGQMTHSIYTKDCVFVDPTTRVQGIDTYSKAVASLFSQQESRADLISIEAVDPHLIKTRWRFAASLNIPGKPKLKPYTGITMYKINSEGQVYEHREEWDISALDAFVSILFPNFGSAPAPPVEHPVDI